MRKIYTYLLCFLLIGASSQLWAQAECDGNRYLNEVFPALDLTSNITFGSNYDRNGDNTSLELDIYEPQGDAVTAAPLIIWVHGGNFLQGSKTGSDVVPLAQVFGRMGYVTSSINYRLGLPIFNPTEKDLAEAVLRAVHDTKAAVRYFYKDASTTDTYKIDTNRIFIGGVSAGGATVVHYAYLDDLAELPGYIDTTTLGLGGGMPGNSGNPGYSDNVAGVINIAGAIDEISWIYPGDEPLVSLHGNEDQTVPYGFDTLTFLGFYPLMEVYGSGAMHPDLAAKGINNCLFTHWGADHTPHVGSQAYTDTTINVIKFFIHGITCQWDLGCYPTLVNVENELSQGELKLYPNPASTVMTVEFPSGLKEEKEIQLVDLMGKTVIDFGKMKETSFEIDRNNLPAGMYLLRVQSSAETKTYRVMFD